MAQGVSAEEFLRIAAHYGYESAVKDDVVMIRHLETHLSLPFAFLPFARAMSRDEIHARFQRMTGGRSYDQQSAGIPFDIQQSADTREAEKAEVTQHQVEIPSAPDS